MRCGGLLKGFLTKNQPDVGRVGETVRAGLKGGRDLRACLEWLYYTQEQLSKDGSKF